MSCFHVVFDNSTSPRKPIVVVELLSDWSYNLPLSLWVERELDRRLAENGYSSTVLTGGSTSEVARAFPETWEYLKDIKRRPISVSRHQVSAYSYSIEALACAIFMCVKEEERQELPSKEEVQRAYPDLPWMENRGTIAKV